MKILSFNLPKNTKLLFTQPNRTVKNSNFCYSNVHRLF